MTAAYYPNNQLASAYTYDADGRRTRRKILGSEAWQVYGIDGELLAEYAGGGAPSAPQKEYGYRNGELLVTAESAGQVNWIVSDHLGTPRIVADLSGTLANTKRHDYLPFGEELFAGTGGRTTGQGYVADNIRQKFTGKERDNETELDYFLARYYSPAQGRFTSPDEFSGGPDELFDFVDDAADNPTFYADIANPQSLNKYQYCYNNPINLIDPDGHETDDTDFDQEQQSSLKPVLNPDRDITQKPYGSQPYDTEKRKKERLDYQQYRVDCQKAGLCVDSIERIPDPSIIDNPRNRTRNTTSPSSQPGEIRRRQTGKPPGNTRPSSSSPKMSKGGKQNKRDSEFANKGDKEISKKARDKSLPAKERRRYQTEEKARKERNKQKRESQ
jgi:RHS repeat-associated protein